jgi:hypothetical protein
MGPALPRPWDTFLSGAFGPFNPILPMPLDAPAVGGDGRPAPRRYEYPVGWNLPIGMPGSEGLTLAAFATLRQLAQRYSTVWGMINLRVKELVGLDWDIGPTKDAQREARLDKNLASDQSTRSKKLVNWFRWHIDPNYTDGFQSWFTALLWDQFVLDAVAVHPLPTRVPGKGLFGSGLAHWEALDAATIRPLVDVRGALPMPPAVAYQQYLWGVPRVDMMQVLAIGDPDEAEAVMDAAGIPVDLDDADPDGQYRMDQLHYWRQTPWTNSPYGLPPVAAALIPIAIGLQRQIWLSDYWGEGTIPGVFVVAGPSYATPTQQAHLQDSLNALAGDVAWKHRIIVLPPDSKALPQKDLSFSKDVDLAIMELLYPVLQIQPQEIGQMPGGRTSGMGGSAATQMMQEAASHQRTKPDRKVWKQRFDRCIQQDFGQADLEWKWVADEEQEDPDKRAAAEASDIAHGIRTIDDVVVDHGGDPYGLPLTSSPIFVLGTGIIPLDPSVSAPAPIAPGASAPGAPAGGSDAAPNEPDGTPAAGAPTPSGAAQDEAKPEGEPAESPEGEGPPRASEGEGHVAPSAGDEGDKLAKLSLADVVKWRIRYKDSKLPSTIHGYLLRSYPDDQVTWAADDRIEWSHEPHVKLDDINWTRRPGGRNLEKEQEIAESLLRGATMDPIVLCEFESKGVYNRAGLTVADGFHRTGAANKAGWKDVPAFIGRKVPDKYRDRIRGSMQDESSSVNGKAAAAELAVLRRYLKAGHDPTHFAPSALTREQVDRIGKRAAEVGPTEAIDEARKDISVGSPVDSGLAPFDLEGAAPNAEERIRSLHKAGNPQALIDWYNDGADGQINWGSDGDFDQCVGVASRYMAEDDAKGFCNLRHQDAVGGPPGSEGKVADQDLLRIIDAELARRGVDVTKLA